MSTQVYICHNVAEKKSFEVASLNLVPEMYYSTTYLISVNSVQELISKIGILETGLYIISFEKITSNNESSPEYTSFGEEDFTPLTSSTIIEYNSECSDEIINPLYNERRDTIVNPLYQQTKAFNDCTESTFNETSSIEEEDFTPLTSSTINEYNSECIDEIINPLYQQTEAFFDCTESTFNETSSIDEKDFTPSEYSDEIANPLFNGCIDKSVKPILQFLI